MAKTSKKPLHVYEQSMLLVTLLFARKNIDDILGFLPNEQIERMTVAKNRFLKLEQSDRVTKIILELRRLLLYSQRKIGWIHQSWIDDGLAKEPIYLQPIIKSLLQTNLNKVTSQEQSSCDVAIPHSVIFHSFLNQFETTQKKVAIFDPILMRLQSMKESDQEKIFANIGIQALICLSQTLNKQRLAKFMQIKLPNSSEPLDKNNPFADHNLKTITLHHIIGLRHHKELSLEVELGLFIIAIHLSNHSRNWQATTALILKKPLGQRFLQAIKAIKPNLVTPPQHELTAGLLLNSIDVV